TKQFVCCWKGAEMLKQQTKLRVRLYARLSKDDGDADKESNSITNQLQMLRYNAKEKGFEVIGEYVDDGYSGTTFNRPDLNRMIKDAMDDPEPSGIMVKDMSRFGRNNAMFMYYVEEIFPNNDILFIALNDDVDTRFDENEMMPFKSIMNEYYARDTSKKIRSVKKTTALSGGFCGSFAPYGYVVDPENKRKLLVDSDTAPIVKRIFELSKQGNSVHQIARTLCEDGVLIPRAYRAMKNGTLETSTGFKFPTDWVAKNVKMILENQVYLGHMVSHKTQTKSFKNKKPVAVPKEEWIIVRNTHEAIIDEETFELVQKFISVKKQPNKTGRPNIFVGLVKCPDCGRNMAFSNPNGREPRFRCRTYVRNSNLCTTHAISYEALQQIVMSDIQKHIKNMEALGDQFIQEMHELSEKGGSKKIKQFEKDLEVAEKRIAEIDSVIMKLFEQNALGKISDERFEKMSSAYESEQKELAQKRDELRTKIRAEEKKTQSTNQFLETIRKYETVTELNRSMLVELIDSIYVYQAEGTGKDRKQRVKINYRFLAGSQCGIA
ncbi:MAG: recombinase family protein, partial [Clostridia bacterium]